MFLIRGVHYHHVLNGAKYAVNGLRKNATLLKITNVSTYMAPVRNMYMMYIIHTALLKDFFPINGKVGPGICCRSDAVMALLEYDQTFCLFSCHT